MSRVSSSCTTLMNAWPGREALRHLHADRARLDGIGEALDHGQRHIGIQQREANFAHRLGDIVVGQSAAAGKRLQRGGRGWMVSRSNIVRLLYLCHDRERHPLGQP